MAVVKTKSNLFPDLQAGGVTPDPARSRGRAICVAFAVANLATDSNLSSYHLCDIPADAILDSRTAFLVTNWGFAQINIGTRTDVDALVTQTKATGNVVTPIAFGDAKHGLPAWQVLGLAAAPDDGVIGIYAHASAAATSAGSMKGEVHYRFR